MMNLGDNCKWCLCAKCKHLEECGIMNGNTKQYCEDDCFGENKTTNACSNFERIEKA